MPRQVPTIPITVPSILRHPAFKRGLDEIRAGVAFDSLTDCWYYERGRLFGAIAPLNMLLHVGGKLNPQAIKLYTAAAKRGLIP
jgi:hypothetical protein